MNERNIIILKKRIDRCINVFIRNLNYLSQCRSDEYLKTIDYYESILDELQEGTRLILDFNNLKEDIGKVRPCGVVVNLEIQQAGKTVQNINNVLRELQTAQDCLYHFLKPNLNKNEKIKIVALQKELEELEKKDCDILIIQNLKEALSEVESNHYLAGAMISARLIDHIIRFIKEKESLPKANINDEIVKRLRELKVLEKDDVAGSDKKFFIDASKSSRDEIIHKIRYFPNAPECFSLLSYAFRMSDLLIKYLEKKNEKS